MSQYDNNAIDETPPSPTQSVRPKQRSMLPQPGTPRTTIRPVTLSDAPMEPSYGSSRQIGAADATKPANTLPLARGTAVTGSRLGRLRPRSMYQTESTSLSSENEAERKTTAQSMRPPTLLSKPSISSLGRAQSLRKPVVSTQHAPPASNMTISRTQPTSTAALARSNTTTTRPRTTAERPKSMHIPSGPSVQAIGNSARPEPAIARKSARLAGLSRSASVKTRSDGASSVTRSLVATKPDEHGLPQAKPKELTKDEPKRVARPAFSTLQQHFTPRKTGKAPTSTFLHPAPVTTSDSLPPELITLQMDLLQLHLLHENASEVSKHWEISAKRALHSKFDEVSSLYHVMLQHEQSGQEQKNLQALLEWTKDKPHASLVEYIQILSGPLHELPSLVQAGGRYQRHVGAFEQWMSWVGEVRDARQNRTEAGLGSVEGLGDAWKAENAALMRKLSSFARDVNGLSQPIAGSSIASIVACCEALLDGLLEELRIMQTIEADVVSHEKDWVEKRLQGIAADIGSFLVEETPAWRT